MNALQQGTTEMRSEINLTYIFLGRIYLFLGGIGDPLITGMLEWIHQGEFMVRPDRYLVMLMCFSGLALSFSNRLKERQKLLLFDVIYFCFSIYEVKTLYTGGFSGTYQAANMIVISLIYTVLRSRFLLQLYTLTIIGSTLFFLLITPMSFSQQSSIALTTSVICLINYGVWAWRLKESQETYRTKALFHGILDVSQNGIIALVSSRTEEGAIDDFLITHINKATYELFPFLKELEETESLSTLIPLSFGGGWFDQLVEVVERGRSLQMEEHYVMPGGAKYWVNIIITKLGDGLTVTLQDISKQRMYEKALEGAKAMAESGAKAKSNFLATMSHEIRTPMNGIIGMVDLLDNTELTQEQIEHLEIIRTSSDNLLITINDILDFSKIESGKLELERRDFSLRNCVETTLDQFGEAARIKDLDLFYFIEPSVPEFIKGDEVRLSQILSNLVANGIKFTAEGEIFVHVELGESLGPQADNVVPIHFTVRDTGIGIPAEKIPLLFTAFQQIDNTNTRQFGGTGLGLAICCRLCQIMNGRVWAESTQGVGSRFQFVLPLEKGIPVDKHVPLVTEEDMAMLMGKKALIVDDNATNLMILQAFVEELGIYPELCSSPIDALEWVQNRPYDLVITDFNMPEMDGLGLAEAMRETFTGPILLLSSSQVLPIQKIRKVIDQYHFKPIRKKQLRYVVLELMKIRREGKKQLAKSTRQVLKADLALDIPIRILLAEDYIVNQKIAVRMFNKLGYEIDIVENGKEAVERVQQSDYDLIFMDVQMPEMDGLEATRIIRKLLRHNSPMIIAMTANAMPEDREKCLEAGMDDYLSKPFKPRELQQILEKYKPILKSI